MSRQVPMNDLPFFNVFSSENRRWRYRKSDSRAFVLNERGDNYGSSLRECWMVSSLLELLTQSGCIGSRSGEVFAEAVVAGGAREVVVENAADESEPEKLTFT
jgi:hypothetical protein